MKGSVMQGETEKYAWLLRLLYGNAQAAARALGVPKQTFSDWSNSVHETRYENIKAMKTLLEEKPLSVRYGLLIGKLDLQKSRQGQRNDLKKALQPLPVLGCKEKSADEKLFLPLRLDADEVNLIIGRTDEWLAEMLPLPSKNSVHYLKKVMTNSNPALIAKMDKGEFTPYQAAEFVALPLDEQNALLSKSRAAQIAGIKAWKVKQKQGGDKGNKKRGNH